MGEKMDEEGKNMVVVEMYRWVLVLPPRSGILQVYIVLKFTNSLLDFVEVEIMINKAGTPVKAGFVQTQLDDPSEYIDFVFDVLTQLFNVLEVSEEHYTCDTYL